MSRWFRLYDDLVDDPKIQRLPGETVKALLNLWCLASQNDGLLPAADDIAFKLRMKPAKVQHLLSVLGECGLVDSDETGLRPHNWNARQYRSDVSTERVKRFRKRDGNVSSTVSETPPETEQKQITEADTETDKGKRTRVGALAEPWSEADRERFWAEFPNKIGKADAMKAFAKASHKTTPDVLFPALQSYRTKTDDRPFCNPSTWLNQERWLDQPAKGKQNGRRTIHDAADDLLAKVRAFEEPTPDRVCDREGEDTLRLLPPR